MSADNGLTALQLVESDLRSVEADFARLDKRLSLVGVQVDNHERSSEDHHRETLGRLKAMDKRFDSLEARFDGVGTLLGRLVVALVGTLVIIVLGLLGLGALVPDVLHGLAP